MKSTFFTIAQIALLKLLAPGQNPDSNPNAFYDLIKDGTLYIKTDVTTGTTTGQVQLIDSSTRVVVGLSTFNGTQLRAGQNFMLEQIRFGVSQVASTVTTTGAMQAYSIVASSCPLPLLGANLMIRQGGVTVIDIPIKRLLREANSVEKSVGRDGYYLDTPKLLKPELETEISIRFPDAAAAVTYTANMKQYIELLLIGPEAATTAK